MRLEFRCPLCRSKEFDSQIVDLKLIRACTGITWEREGGQIELRQCHYRGEQDLDWFHFVAVPTDPTEYEQIRRLQISIAKMRSNSESEG